jgi:hypothetical protein
LFDRRFCAVTFCCAIESSSTASRNGSGRHAHSPACRSRESCPSAVRVAPEATRIDLRSRSPLHELAFAEQHAD